MAERTRRLSAFSDRQFDLLVIGGGITGCGIARDAALRGLSVALVEKNDFASGTSSRSSRLIHGGVRYLEHGHLGLVFEASAERRRLLRLAPHLVRPLRFTCPVFRGARIRRWKLLAGLTLYDALALFRNVGKHHRLDASEVLALQPALEPHDLVGGATYFDAATDDSRLALAVVLDARARGAAVLNHARVTRLVVEGGRTSGAEVRDELTGASVRIHAATVVNATGPWSDDLRRLEGGGNRPTVQGSKGVHITVPQERIGNHDALTLLSPTDGRVMFVLPSGARSIIRTTDTFTGESPDEIRATEADVDYLLAAANRFFPAPRLTRDDVISAWAGIRPLAATEATGSSVSASREHAISVSAAGMVTITGGKLTTFRVMAAQTVDIAMRQLGRGSPGSQTADVPIGWSDSTSLDAVIAEATRTVGDPDLAVHLVSSHGASWPDVWKAVSADAVTSARVVEACIYRIGELRYACEVEMAQTLADLLIRRTRVAFETKDHGVESAERVATYVASLLGWNSARISTEVARYRGDVDRMFRIDPR